MPIIMTGNSVVFYGGVPSSPPDTAPVAPTVYGPTVTPTVPSASVGIKGRAKDQAEIKMTSFGPYGWEIGPGYLNADLKLTVGEEPWEIGNERLYTIAGLQSPQVPSALVTGTYAGDAVDFNPFAVPSVPSVLIGSLSGSNQPSGADTWSDGRFAYMQTIGGGVPFYPYYNPAYITLRGARMPYALTTPAPSSTANIVTQDINPAPIFLAGGYLAQSYFSTRVASAPTNAYSTTLNFKVPRSPGTPWATAWNGSMEASRVKFPYAGQVSVAIPVAPLAPYGAPAYSAYRTTSRADHTRYTNNGHIHTGPRQTEYGSTGGTLKFNRYSTASETDWETTATINLGSQPHNIWTTPTYANTPYTPYTGGNYGHVDGGFTVESPTQGLVAGQSRVAPITPNTGSSFWKHVGWPGASGTTITGLRFTVGWNSVTMGQPTSKTESSEDAMWFAFGYSNNGYGLYRIPYAASPDIYVNHTPQGIGYRRPKKGGGSVVV